MIKRKSKKIPAHFGMKDYYKFFCKIYPNADISRSKFNKIISEYNEKMSELLIEELTYTLPLKMGTLEILKDQRKVYENKEGKIINNKPVDWKATNNLWKLNEEAKKKKVLIRHENKHTNGYVFRVYYNKSKANFKNKTVYSFSPIRELKRNITQRIVDYSKKKYDTFIKK